MATLDNSEYKQNKNSEESLNQTSRECCSFENASLLNDVWQSSLEKIHDWHESFASYVYFKEKIIGKVGRTDKKFEFKWLETNDLYLESVQSAIDADKDYWISAAEVSEKIKDKDGKPVLREKWVTSMPCHFLILDLTEAVEAENLNLDFNLSGEQMSALVLEHCRQRGLPEPIIWGDHEELAIVWSLETPYFKSDENYHTDSRGNIVLDEFKFNSDWDDVQNLLCEDFKYLGANPKKKHALTLVRVPGTFNTHANAPVRVLHDAEKTTLEEIKSGLAYVCEKIKNQEKIERPNLDDEINEFYREYQEFLKFCDETDGTDAQIKKFAPKQKIKKSQKKKKEKESGFINPYVTLEDFERAKKNLEKLIAEQSKNNVGENLTVPPERSEEYQKFLNQLRQDVLQIHPASDRYVYLGFKTEATPTKEETWRQTPVLVNDLEKELTELWLQPDFYDKNVYVSQAEFLSSRNRTEDNVASLSLSFLDIDGKFAAEQKNLTPEEWVNLVLEECRSKEIPLPSIMIFSGNGLHVKWLYKEAVTRKKLVRWTRLQKKLCLIFKDFGADAQGKDAARVLRVPGTKNCKAETIDRDVRVVYSNPERYDFEDFAEIIFKISGYGDDGEDFEFEETEMLEPCFKIKNETTGEEFFLEKSEIPDFLNRQEKSHILSRSIAEFNDSELKSVHRLYCNYAVLSAEKIPGANFKEKTEKIKARCAEYWNGLGFQIPNSIMFLNGKLIAVWKYSDYLPGKALSRWQRTQEVINYHFEDWGARNDAEYHDYSALLPLPEFTDGKAEVLKFDAKYKFDDLANRVLIFSQPEVREYKKKRTAEKAKAKAERDIKNLASFKIAPKKRTGSFAGQAARRYADIVKLIELRADSRGEVPQGHRELSVFWALVCAAQAGLISDYEEFDALRCELVNKNGLQFRIETYAALFGTLRNKFIRHEELYKARTETLIEELGITVSEQAELEVLRYFPKKEKKPKKIPLRILKPWEDEGKTERTWYRHRQKAREALALESAKKEESKEKNLTALSVKMRLIILKVFLENFATQILIDTNFILSGRKFPYIMRGIDEREYYYFYGRYMENDSSEVLGGVFESFIHNHECCLEIFIQFMTQGVGLEKNHEVSFAWFVCSVGEAAGSRRCYFSKTRPPFSAFFARPPPRFSGR